MSENPELDRLNDALRSVMTEVRTTTAPSGALAEAAALLERVGELLAPHRHPGPYAQASLEGSRAILERDLSDPMRVFPYSPYIGRRNPVAPPVDFEVRGGVVHGSARFGPLYAGFDQSVHGGVIAAVFDELLGTVSMVNDAGAFTGTLTVRYRTLTPLLEPIRIEGRQEGREGRKSFASGKMWHGDTLTAEAEGVFIRPTLSWRSEAEEAPSESADAHGQPKR